MSDKTAIEWAEATWNPVTGCTKVSPGCKFCYAERITERWGQKFTDVKLHPDRLDQPIRWKRPRRIFVCSMSDLFHEKAPLEFVDKIFAVMALSGNHTFQILTKRPERMAEYFRDGGPVSSVGDAAKEIIGEPVWAKGFPLENVWLGVSVENQEQADKRIPVLLETPAAVRFLSVEPLLELVDLTPYVKALNWVIVGGESGGPPYRSLVLINRAWKEIGPGVHIPLGPYQWFPQPDRLKWVRSIRDQCLAAGVPFFFKQWGGPTPKSGGRLLDGKEWSEYPGERR